MLSVELSALAFHFDVPPKAAIDAKICKFSAAHELGIYYQQTYRRVVSTKSATLCHLFQVIDLE